MDLPDVHRNPYTHMFGAVQITDKYRQAVFSGVSPSDQVISTPSLQKRKAEIFEDAVATFQLVVFGDRWDKAESKAAVTNLYEERKLPGWDGDDAPPVTDATRKVCFAFIDALPFASAKPTIIPDPDGEISFEWRNKEGMLSVSVSGNGRLVYIAREGLNRPSDTLFWAPENKKLPMPLHGMISEFE